MVFHWSLNDLKFSNFFIYLFIHLFFLYIYIYIYIYIAQHLKKHSCPTTQLRKILTDNTTILEHQNNKQKLQILEALHIRNLQPAFNRINYQTSANVLKCL